MATVHERLYVETPYAQSAGAFARRLGISPGSDRGECSLTLALPVTREREIARTVKAHAVRAGADANYTTRYRISWEAGLSSSGIPTPAFSGVLTIAAGQDYDETVLQLDGRYEPPAGTLGEAFDEFVGKRVAHATMSALLGGVGAELTRAHEQIETAKRT
jgi:hypothetical protein